MVNNFDKINVCLGKGIKNDEKVAKNIRVRMNISKMSDMKIIQNLKKLERIEKSFESIL